MGNCFWEVNFYFQSRWFSSCFYVPSYIQNHKETVLLLLRKKCIEQKERKRRPDARWINFSTEKVNRTVNKWAALKLWTCWLCVQRWQGQGNMVPGEQVGLWYPIGWGPKAGQCPKPVLVWGSLTPGRRLCQVREGADVASPPRTKASHPLNPSHASTTVEQEL